MIVILEAGGDMNALEVDAVARLAGDLNARLGALYAPDRYALQVPVDARDHPEALSVAVSRWRDAVARLGLTAWDLVRAEVLTAEEFERDLARPPDPAAIWSIGEGGDQAATMTVARELLERAFNDPLTGLVTLETFKTRLERNLLFEDQSTLAVLCLDLVAFGTINDRLGHTVADQVLVTLAQRLTAAVRPGDAVARVGGDEFGVLFEHICERHLAAVTERILALVQQPVAVNDQEVELTVNAGVALGRPGLPAEALLANAFAAASAVAPHAERRYEIFGLQALEPSASSLALRADDRLDRLAYLLLLQQAAVAANESLTLEAAARAVLRQMCTHTSWPAGHLYLLSAEHDRLVPAGIWHLPADGRYEAFQLVTEATEFPVGVGLPGRVCATGTPEWIRDIGEDPDFVRAEAAARAGLAAAFAFPVVVDGQPVAVLEFFAPEPAEPNGTLLEVVTTVGTQLARVVERARARTALEASEAKARESERQLREAQRLARVGSWRFDLRTGKGYGSEELYRLHGLDPSGPGLDLTTILEDVHPADQGRVQAALTRLAESGEQTGEEFRIVRPDGEVLWVRSEGLGIRDETGLVIAIQGTAQDITETKLAEEALRERERQLAEAEHVARMGSWEVDLATGQVTWSEAMRRLWRFEEGPSTPSLESFLARLHPEDVPRMLRIREHLLAGGDPTSVHVRARFPDGEEGWFAARSAVVLDEQGAPVRLCGTVREITAEKEAELARRAEEERHRCIVETTYGGLWTTDAEGKTTYVNARMAEMLGYSVEEMLRQPVASLVAEEHRHRVGTNARRRRSGISEQYEVTLLGKDRTEVRALVLASPLVDDDGRYVGSLALVSDVTGWRVGADGRVPNDERHD